MRAAFINDCPDLPEPNPMLVAALIDTAHRTRMGAILGNTDPTLPRAILKAPTYSSFLAAVRRALSDDSFEAPASAFLVDLMNRSSIATVARATPPVVTPPRAVAPKMCEAWEPVGEPAWGNVVVSALRHLNEQLRVSDPDTITSTWHRVVESLVSGSREIFNADLAVTRVDSLIADALDIAQARGIPRDNPLLAMLVITDAALTFQMNRVPGHPTEPALRLLARYTDLATLQKFCGAIVGSAKLSLRLAGMDGTPIYAEQVSTMLTELTHAFHCERDRARFGTVRDAACKLEVAFLEVQPDRPTDRLAELWALELSRDPGPEFPPGLGNGLN